MSLEQSENGQRLFNNGKYRKDWSFPPIVELKLKDWIVSPCLHVCSGASMIGDVRLDLHMKADIKGTMYQLPFPDRTFQTVLIDPPWHQPYHLRPKLLWELRRGLRLGGRLILNCPWIPNIPRMTLEKVMVGRPSQFWTNVSLVGFYRRDQVSLDHSYPMERAGLNVFT